MNKFVLLLLLLLLEVRVVLAQPQGPFQPDSLTIALWHMDYILPDCTGGAFTFYQAGNANCVGAIPSVSGGYFIGVSATWDDRDMDIIRTDDRGVPGRPPRNYGGAESQYMLEFTETAQGTIAMIGYESGVTPHPDIIFIAVDADGNEIGRQTYGDTLSDYGVTICAGPDETFLIGGNTTYAMMIEEGIYQEHRHAVLYLINTEGEILSEFALQNELRQHHDSGVSSIIKTSDHGYLILCSYSDWDDWFVCLAKYSSDLELEWLQILELDYGRGVYEMTQIDDHYFMIGETTDRDIWLKKFDLRGNIIFENTYGTDRWDHGYSLFKTIEGGYAIAGGGYWKRGAQHFDMSLIKLSEGLQFQWARAWGREEIDFAVKGAQNPDGSFLLFGVADLYTSAVGAIRTSPYQYPGYDYSGNFLNGRHIGTVDTIAGVWNTAFSLREDGEAVIEVADNELLHQQTFTIEGWIRPDTLRLGLGAIFSKSFDDQAPSFQVLFNNLTNVLTFKVLRAPDDLFEVTAQVPNTNGDWSYFGAVCGENSLGLFWNDEKVGEVPFTGEILYSDLPLYIGGGNAEVPAQAQFYGDIDELRVSEGVRDYLALSVSEPSSLAPTTAILFDVSPNPFNSSTTISFSVGAHSNAPVHLAIYDLSGRLVTDLVNSRLSAGTHEVVWDAGDLGAGVFLVRLKAGKDSKTVKMLLLR